MSDRRLMVKFYRTDLPKGDPPYWRWHDAVCVPRIGEYVAQPGSTTGYLVTSVTWVEVNEVNVLIEHYVGEVVL